MNPRLLRLCNRANMLKVVVHIFQLLSRKVFDSSSCRPDGKDPRNRIGVRNAEVAKAIASAVQIHGSESLSSAVMDLTKECAFTQWEAFAQLAEQLICVGNMDAAALVYQTAFGVFEAPIAKLESQKIPEFTWCQPLAQIPDKAVETFLKGPEGRYVHRRFQSLCEARSFAETHFECHSDASNGYSAIATPGGKGDTAFCEIQKTGSVFKANMESWLNNQEEIKSWRLEQGKFRSKVFEISIRKTTKPPQPDSKRRKVETEAATDK